MFVRSGAQGKCQGWRICRSGSYWQGEVLYSHMLDTVSFKVSEYIYEQKWFKQIKILGIRGRSQSKRCREKDQGGTLTKKLSGWLSQMLLRGQLRGGLGIVQGFENMEARWWSWEEWLLWVAAKKTWLEKTEKRLWSEEVETLNIDMSF